MAEPGGVLEAVGALWAALTGRVGEVEVLRQVTVIGEDPVLPSVFRVGTAAAASVATATLAVAVFGAERTGAPVPPVRVAVRQAVAAFRSERYLRIDGRTEDIWGSLS